MFAKLLKYEWKGSYKLLGTLSICALGCGLLATGLLRLIAFFDGKMVNNPAAVFAVVICGFLLFGLYMGAVLLVSGSQFWLYYRFYKTKFTDEGYLTFTLPVKPWKIFAAAMTNIYLWGLIIGLSVAAALLMALLLGAQVDLRQVFGVFIGEDAAIGMMILYLPSLISALTNNVLVMASITAGAVAAKKHKILAAVGIYFGQSIVQGTVSSVIAVIMMFLIFAETAGAVSFAVYCLLGAVPLLWGIGAYILSVKLLNNKLNLP